MSFELSLESLEVEEPREISMESLESELEKNRKQIRELNRVSKDLSARGVINRGVAASIESLADTVPSLESHFKSYPVQSYTEGFTRTNLKVTQEGLVGGIVSAVVNALKKIAGWIGSAFKWLWNMITGKKETCQKAEKAAEVVEEAVVVFKPLDLNEIFKEAQKESERQIAEIEKTARATSSNLDKANNHAAETEASMKRMAEEAKRNNELMEKKLKEQRENQAWIERNLAEMEASDLISTITGEVEKSSNLLTLFVSGGDSSYIFTRLTKKQRAVSHDSIVNGLTSMIYDGAKKNAEFVEKLRTMTTDKNPAFSLALDPNDPNGFFIPVPNEILGFLERNGSGKHDPFTDSVEEIKKALDQMRSIKVEDRTYTPKDIVDGVKSCRTQMVKHRRYSSDISTGAVEKDLSKISISLTKLANSLSSSDMTESRLEGFQEASEKIRKNTDAIRKAILILENMNDERIRFTKACHSSVKSYIEGLINLDKKGLLAENYKTRLNKFSEVLRKTSKY